MDVIFDTNPYRYLAAERSYGETLDLVQKIKEAQRQKGIDSWMAPTVWLELFNHLADENDPHFAECLGATVASYAHTRIFGRGRNYRLAPRANMAAAQTLFGFSDQDENRIIQDFDQLAEIIYFEPTAEVISQHRKQLEVYRNFLRREEEGFMTRFTENTAIYKERYSQEQDVVKKMRAKSVLREMYRGYALREAARIDVDKSLLTEKDVEALTDQVEKFFPAPFQLYLSIVERLVQNPDLNIYKKSRRNWYWDFQMLFYISKNNSTTVVTDDGDMYKAAEAAGIGDRIKTLSKYCEELQVEFTMPSVGGR